MKQSLLRALRSVWARPKWDSEAPIRGELFSVERLEQHAETLAAAQRVTARPTRGRPLARRLRENGRVLLAAYRSIGAAIREERAITPAAEWLVDNFHVVEAQIREIRDDLPRGFYRLLPKLADGPLAGYPRVFGIAWAFVAHNDSRLDPEVLLRFVRAYQRVQPLTIGELWALAITLRILFVENLRRSAERIVRSRAARQAADTIADRLLGIGRDVPESAADVLRSFESTDLSHSFAVQLIQRLRDQDPAVTPALRWLDERLAAQGTSAEEIVREELQLQGAANVTVRNVITSMRLMSDIDWADFFESVSLVDAALRAESGFATMDFATRDRYRHAIEDLARGAGRTEIDVTRAALDAAQRSVPEPRDDEDATAQREADPGYHLISNGRLALERELGFRAPVGSWFVRATAAAGILGYLGSIAVATAALLAVALLGAAGVETSGAGLVVLALLALIPASDAAVVLVNRIITDRFAPKALPGLALRDGVPASLRTLVAVPTLLTTHAEIDEQIERLEVHHLAGSGGDVRFALLSDWTDADSENEPDDDALLATARAGIAGLNLHHEAAADGPRFLLLHRRRVWNASEGRWIGWERKRGKLHELNRLLRGATDTGFMADVAGGSLVPSGIRYVITLDADTRLPRDVVKRLVGKMAHPLNRPRLDPRRGRVVEGYAVLQPRVTPSLPMGREGSLFQRIFSGPGGLDPYAFTVSDVYQDLFGQGSYTGKGIYDVDVFEAALAGRVPENALLSHDLLEGIFAGAGLVSDIEVVEEHPARYDVAAARQHRWARGDWQLLPWIIGRGRDSSGDPERRAIPWIGRWKMLDNLRRSLSAPAAFGALVAGWTLPIASPFAWSAFVLATLAMPAFLPFFLGLVPRRLGISKRSHLLAVAGDFGLALRQLTFLTILLAHQAWLMSDAIVRTLWRLLVQRRLLEWVTAAQASLGPRLDLPGFYRRMSGAVVLVAAAAIAIVLLRAERGAWAVAAPFLAAWLVSPAIALWSSRAPPPGGRSSLDEQDALALRGVARRTWRFFEAFVTPADHMLPPDNFQEDPAPVVAHRTSPTNLGLYLLSTVAARDFGWLGTIDMVERLEATLATMERLERFRGHFYNWYGTQDLRPLDPKYVSSVDSGNLAGHLIALDRACRERIEAPLIDAHCFAGIADALALTREAVRALAQGRHAQTVTWKQLEEALDGIDTSLEAPAATPVGVAERLALVSALAETLVDIARTLTLERGDEAGAEVLVWAEALRACVASHERDVELLPPLARSRGDEMALASIPPLSQLPDLCEAAIDAIAHCAEPDAAHADALARSVRGARSLMRRLASTADAARRFAAEMDFGFLFDRERQLLSIGYRMADGTLDPSCYDLLASEARLASFVAIAKGDVPVKHWFRLGRALTPVDRGSALISWSGSMFEYLMPSLVMRAPAGSLLEQTSHLIVRRHQKYGVELGVPWGVSESAYNARDLELTYQYSNFGVPGLGLKRGLGEDAVVAPYATALAAMVDPRAAVQNFARLASAGALGRFGWYEALDYTPTRLPEGEPVAIVRAHMAHHQGMTIVAIANALADGAMRARFHAEPMIQATELLLQERTPRGVAVARPRAEEVRAVANVRELVPPTRRHFDSPHDPIPRSHLLSNGRYAVMITAAGSGYSRWRDLAVTRWHEDVSCDASGSYVFLRDVQSGALWSAGFQPSGAEPDSYEVEFSEDRVEIARRDGTLATTLVIAVSAEHDAEVRRVSVTNLGTRTREIELSSYAEIVLAPPAADVAHPAFSKLFVATEFVPEIGALIATRRRRSRDEAEVFAAHLAVVEGDRVGDLHFETDRARFLGRGRTLCAALSVRDGEPGAGAVGNVLDPIFSLRCRVRIPPGATARVAFWTLVAPSRNEVLDLADKHQDAAAFQRALTLTWTQAQVQLHHLGIGPDEAHLFQRLANHVLFSDPALRPSSAVLKRNEEAPSALWAHGISGDLPIVLVRIDEADDLALLRQLLRAHQYWRTKRLAVDLVILNERPSSYAQEFQAALEAVVRASGSHHPEGADEVRGAVFMLRADLVSLEVRGALQSAARAVLLGRRGSLSEQLSRRHEIAIAPVARRAARSLAPMPAPPRPVLEFWNGLGGFGAGGREYVTILGEGQWTPAPWINVVANAGFGFQTSVEGGGYTWSGNSRENQLTAWSNDPVGDRPGDVLYVRDEDDGVVLTPTALPIRDEAGHYVARHGPGYVRFEHAAHGLELELLQYVPLADPIKIARLRIRNRTARTRRISVTAYVEWVLGPSRGVAAPFVTTEIDPETGALFARNRWRTSFGERVAFADLAGQQRAWSGDRAEFLGRHGTLADPAALRSEDLLSGRVGAGLDPCAALQTRVELAANGSAEIVFFLGEAATRADASALVARYRRTDLDAVLADVATHWDEVLGTVQVKTPERSLDLMLNRWLLQQTLACRVLARSAFYQASGAYGFRDQLQDGMALAVSRPALTREHLLRAAARQFAAGDVQHWWLPHSGQGVRTQIADDRVWLAYAAAHYVGVTADSAVLDAVVPFLDGPALRDGEHESFFQPMIADEQATLYEHGARALDRSLAVGVHGLPLFGTGDWNDGMNRVGEQGKGESVWLGWFLHASLTAFAPFADARGELARAAEWRAHAARLVIALERDAWDGDWYRRGWFDDGTPLGSAESNECRIDSIAQSWAVLSGAADPERARRAMASVDEQLVRRDDGLVLLFTPPFDRSPVDPGYIKGYPPGVRENGGQYTHAAAWAVVAFAALGDGDKAAGLFSLLNPIHHTSTRAAVHRYKVEPYVACADVYAVAPHVGRGGWTWYTGAAGWLYRAGLESILGFRVQGTTLVLDPCIPKAWPGFEITYQHGSSRYEIAVENPRGVSRGVTRIELDDVTLADPAAAVPLVDDGATHRVRVVLG